MTSEQASEARPTISRSVGIMFAGGGTGGHLYPGLAIARAIVGEAPQVVPHFIGARRGVERDILAGTGFQHTLLDLHPLYRSRPWMNWRTAAGAVSSWRAISRLAREVRPRAVIGTGGYAAGVALAWAGAHGVPTLLHEPDSYPGLTTRTFVRWARAIYLGFPEAAGMLSLGSHTEVLEFGCPIDPPPAVLPSRAAARAKWDLPEDAFTVLVVGGSQGARVINETIADWIDGGLPENVCLVWATGRQHAGVWLDRASHTVKVQPYLSRIADAYAVADMAVARAGAMSIAELCAWGIPTILVPLPSAAQDHQTHNARATAQAGGALYLAQRDFTAVWLDAEVRALRADPLRLAGMSGAMRARARPEAAQAIARSILAILGISPIGIAGSGGSSFPEA